MVEDQNNFGRLWEFYSVSKLLPFDVSGTQCPGTPVTEYGVPVGLCKVHPACHHRVVLPKNRRGNIVTMAVREAYKATPKKLRKELIKHLELNLTGPGQALASRIEAFYSRRDDRIQIMLAGIVTAILISSELAADITAVENLKRHIVKHALLHGCDVVTKFWKATTNEMQRIAFRSVVERPDGYIIDLSPDSTSLEAELYRLIVSVNPDVFDLSKYGDEPSEKELWMIAHLAQTRYLPLPSIGLAEEKVTEYINSMTSHPDNGKETDDAILNGCYSTGYLLGTRVRKKLFERIGDTHTRNNLPTQLHLSITGGSCWEASREMRGKWHILKQDGEFVSFLNGRISEYFEVSEDKVRKEHIYTDNFGNLVTVLSPGDQRVWSHAYVTQPLTGSIGDVLDEVVDVGGNLAKGFDARLGQLIFIWAGIKRKQFESSGRNLRAKLITVLEPGGKIRPLTSGETWFYLYTVPASHWLKDTLMSLPGARVGLAESDHLYRMGKSYKRHFCHPSRLSDSGRYQEEQKEETHDETPENPSDLPEFISTSDLTAATDNAHHERSITMTKGYCNAVLHSSDSEWAIPFSDYILDCISLTCSPREVFFTLSHRRARKLAKKAPIVMRDSYPSELEVLTPMTATLLHGRDPPGAGSENDYQPIETPQNQDSRRLRAMSADASTGMHRKSKRQIVSFTTNIGVLMGDPMAKCVLTMASMSSWEAARRGYADVKDVKFLDLQGKTRREFHQEHKEGLHANETFHCCGDDHTGVASLEILKRVPIFQQSMGYQISWDKYRISNKYVHYCQNFGLHPRYRSSIVVDTIKLRLLNQFQKGGHNTFEFPDCLIGKARELWRACGRNSEESVFPDIESRMGWLEDLIPFAMRKGMPSYFEDKIVKKELAYINPGMGGIGVISKYRPDRTEFYERLKRYLILCKEFPDQMHSNDPKVTNSWERGEAFRTEMYTFNDMLANRLYTERMTTEEVFEQVSNDLTPSEASAPASKRRTWKAIKRFHIDLNQPNTLLGTKEATYQEVFRDRAVLNTVKRRNRSRHKIQVLERMLHAYAENINDLWSDGLAGSDQRGSWVTREQLYAHLGISQLTPNLFFTIDLFSGRRGRYDIAYERNLDLHDHEAGRQEGSSITTDLSTSNTYSILSD